MKPNLFDLATKELSQDAFIAWLLQWADYNYRKYNEELHVVATAFLKQLISLQGIPPEEIKTVKAERQRKNIDIWAEVNSSHFIVIEDKVGTVRHSDQLARYRKIGESVCKENSWQLICVYIKTHSESAWSLKEIEQEGFAVLMRSDFLAILESHEVSSDIYNDFRDRLRRLENTESQFSLKKIGEWDPNDWKGFYQLLEQSRHVQWKLVNPPGGNSFWNAQLNWFNYEGLPLYMQIEQGKLSFKIGEVYENRRDIRQRFHDLLMSKSNSELGLQRPSSFGSGRYMTVAIIPRSVWLGGDDDILDLQTVVKRLNRYEQWLIGIIEQNALSTAVHSGADCSGYQTCQ